MSISLDNLEITRLFFALIFILSAAHLFGFLFQHLKMPRVIGEITAGIFLSPTILGHYFPQVHQWLFNGFATESKLLATFYWLGLIFLMFVSGFEIQKKVSANDKRTITALVLGGTCIPFIAGLTASHFFDVTGFLGRTGTPIALSIVIGIALAVTSIPVISQARCRCLRNHLRREALVC